VNGHGGNYVLANIVQEASIGEPVMALYPAREDWHIARNAAGLATDHHSDMHAGELETSILLHVAPEVVRPGFEAADHEANDRQLFAMVGMRGYTSSGVIGRPSLASAAKGEALLAEFVKRARPHIEALSSGPRQQRADPS
jgi:creatinine amidohydrolase